MIDYIRFLDNEIDFKQKEQIKVILISIFGNVFIVITKKLSILLRILIDSFLKFYDIILLFFVFLTVFCFPHTIP